MNLNGSNRDKKSSFTDAGNVFLHWIGLELLQCFCCLNCFQENWSLDLFNEVFPCEVALCFYKSIIRPCMEYCYHASVHVHSCFFNSDSHHANLKSRYMEWSYKKSRYMEWSYKKSCYMEWSYKWLHGMELQKKEQKKMKFRKAV